MKFHVHHQHHHSYHVPQHIEAMLRSMNDKLDRLTDRTVIIMAAIDDLKAAQEELASEVTRIAGEIDQLLAVISTPGTPDSEVQAATARARELTASLRSASDKSDQAVP